MDRNNPDGVQKGKHVEAARCIAADTPLDRRGFTPESIANKVNINACVDCLGSLQNESELKRLLRKPTLLQRDI